MRDVVRRMLAVMAALGLATLVACEQPGGSESAAAASPTTAPAPLPPGPDGKVHLSDAQWKARLTPEQYHILREHGTEAPFANAYDKTFTPGTYECAACGQVLFSSKQKFDSGCGWPAFSAAAAGGAVDLVPDPDGSRTEVECSRCGGHLGHVFDDGPPPTGQRFCIDSAAVRFVPDAPPHAAPPTTVPAAK